jgi:hypothetical protein
MEYKYYINKKKEAADIFEFLDNEKKSKLVNIRLKKFKKSIPKKKIKYKNYFNSIYSIKR